MNCIGVLHHVLILGRAARIALPPLAPRSSATCAAFIGRATYDRTTVFHGAANGAVRASGADARAGVNVSGAPA